MLIFVNWISFAGTALKAVANAFKELIPAWDELKKDNDKKRIWDDTKKVIEDDTKKVIEGGSK